MLSREGKEVPPADAPIREAMSETLCARCIHCLDACKGIYKRRELRGGKYVVLECNGFRHMQPNTQAKPTREAGSA